MFAAVSSGKPRPHNGRLQKDECGFHHSQCPGSLLYLVIYPALTQAYGWALATAMSNNNAALHAASQGKGYRVIKIPQWKAQADLVCGPGRNNPTPNMLNNQREGLKSKGTVVPTLSSASNHAIVRHYSRYWPSPRDTAAIAQACGAVHHTLCSCSNCCHTCCAVMTMQPYTSTHHSLGRESDLNQQAGHQVSNEFQSLSPMGSSSLPWDHISYHHGTQDLTFAGLFLPLTQSDGHRALCLEGKHFLPAQIRQPKTSGVFTALSSTWYLASLATLTSGAGTPHTLPPTSYALHWQLPEEVSHFHIRLSPCHELASPFLHAGKVLLSELEFISFLLSCQNS